MVNFVSTSESNCGPDFPESAQNSLTPTLWLSLCDPDPCPRAGLHGVCAGALAEACLWK